MNPPNKEKIVPEYIEQITNNIIHHAERGEIDDVERIVKTVENESLRKTVSMISQEILATKGYEFALNQAKKEAEMNGWGPKSEIYTIYARKIANKEQDDFLFWKAVVTSWKLKILYAKEKYHKNQNKTYCK